MQLGLENTLITQKINMGSWPLVSMCMLMLFGNIASGQTNKKYIGIYKNQIGEKIEIRTDSSYSYSRRVHMEYRWSSGKWSVKNDTIFLKLIAASDTIKATDLHNIQAQNYRLYPLKLFFKSGRVYDVSSHGIIYKGKVQSSFSRKKYSVVYKRA